MPDGLKVADGYAYDLPCEYGHRVLTILKKDDEGGHVPRGTPAESSLQE